MTTEQAEQAKQAELAKQAKQAAHTVAESIEDLISGAEYVLFDFDGPICHLFARHPPRTVAAGLVEWLRARGAAVRLAEDEAGDPHAVLRAVSRDHPGSGLVGELEAELTREELQATRTSWPTAYADPLIRTWSAIGVGLAVATNNSPRVAEEYLTGRGLRECFAPHIHGRTGDPRLLKPDPDCVRRALDSLGADPAASLMIGDTPADLYAAREAGVRFLGYGRGEHRTARLWKAGAPMVVESLEPLLQAVRTLGRP